MMLSGVKPYEGRHTRQQCPVEQALHGMHGCADAAAASASPSTKTSAAAKRAMPYWKLGLQLVNEVALL